MRAAEASQIAHPEQRFVLEELLAAERQASVHISRLIPAGIAPGDRTGAVGDAAKAERSGVDKLRPERLTSNIRVFRL